MRKRNLKRLLALLLCACMIIGLMPAASLAVTTEDTMSATVYTGQESGTGAFTDKTDTFAVDQSGLILHLENFRQAVPDG